LKDIAVILKRTRLFQGIGEEEIASVLECLGAAQRKFGKGEYIFRAGEHIGVVALLLKGSVHIQREDYWGNLSILNEISEGEIFGEAYAAPGSSAMTNDVVAVCDSRVMFLDVQRILAVGPSSCRFHTILIQNLFTLLAEKNRLLAQKLGHMAQRTTREKLLSYLSEQSQKAGSASFTIPFNRQQLADFLSVDRSAMSNELGKMRREGLLEFEKNWFLLK